MDDKPDNLPSWQKVLHQRSRPAELSEADAAVIDAIVDNGVSAEDSLRSRTAMSWVRLIQASPMPEPSADLISRTVTAMETDVPPVLEITAPMSRKPFFFAGRQLTEYAAMAAAAAILISVLIPGIGQARQSAQRAACTSNLSQMARAFSHYAAAESGSLPVLTLTAGGNWLPRARVDELGCSNTDNLLPLLRTNLAKPQSLMCPGLDTTQVVFDSTVNHVPDSVRGYSYANMFGPVRPSWDGRNSTIVLADRNPLFINASVRDPHQNSINHGLRGTNVLTADGAVRWANTPDIGPSGDNIWTIGKDCKVNYQGTEVTRVSDDVFLSP